MIKIKKILLSNIEGYYRVKVKSLEKGLKLVTIYSTPDGEVPDERMKGYDLITDKYLVTTKKVHHIDTFIP